MQREDILQPTEITTDLIQSRNNTMAAPGTVDFIAQDIQRKSANKTRMAEDILMEQNTKSNNFSNVFGSQKKKDLTVETPFDQVYAQVGDEFTPRFKNFLRGTDNNERLARQQTTGEKWGNAMQKLGAGIGIAVAGGTVGTVTGLINGIKKGSFNEIYNDDFNIWLDNLDKKMNYTLPNYYTKQEQNMNFGQSLGTANFWANDIIGNIDFTLGAIVSEGIWAAVTGGSSLATTAARWSLRASKLPKLLKGVSSYSKIGKKYIADNALNATTKQAAKQATRAGNIADIANTVRFTYTSAGYEAGVEARHFMKESEENFIHYYETNYGRKPNAKEMSEFKEKNKTAANSLWAGNLALVGGSNLAIFGRMFNLKSPTLKVGGSFKKKFNEKILGLGTTTSTKNGFAKEVIKPTFLQQAVGRTRDFARAPLIEGVWEEGNQSVFGNFANDWVASGYDIEASKTSFDMMGGMYDAYAKTYGTKEGWKEVGIGMIIGLLGGAASGGLNQYGRDKKQQEAIASAVNSELGAQGLTDRLKNKDLYGEAFEETLKQSSVGSILLADRIAATNRLNVANTQEKEAESKGDILGKHLARKKAILASIDLSKSYDRLDEAYDEFKTSLDLVDNKAWAEELGIEETDVEDYKAQVLGEYAELQEEYSANKDFADLIVGRNATTKDLKGKDTVAKAIAYNMTMGTQSMEAAETFLDEINMEFANMVNPERAADAKTALDVKTILETATKENTQAFFKVKKKREELKIEQEALKKEIISVQTKMQRLGSEQTEQKISQQQKLTSLAEQLDNLNTLETTLAEEYNFAFQALQSESPFTDQNGQKQEITADELDKVLELDNTGKITGGTLFEIDKMIAAQEGTNPKRADRLKKLLNEYRKSVYAFKEYNKTIKGISSSEFNPADFATALESKIAGITKREANEFTKEFFANIGNQMAQDTGDLMNTDKNPKEESKVSQAVYESEYEKGDYQKLKKAIERNMNPNEESTKEDLQMFINYPNLKNLIFNLEVRRNAEKKNILKNINDEFITSTPEKNSFIAKREKEIDAKYDNLIENLFSKNVEKEKEVDTLERLIDQTTKENNYVSSYIGENASEAKKNRPTKKQINRLQELVSKLQSTRFFGDTAILEGDPKLLKEQLKEELPLTEKELEELQGLNNRLSNWQVMQGVMVEGVNTTLADLITRVVQLKTTIEKQTKTEQTREDVIKIAEASERNASATRNDVRTIQSLNGVYIKIDKDGSVALSHVNADTLIGKYMNGVSKIQVQKQNSKKKIDVELTDLPKYQKEQGTKFFVTVGEEVIEFSIGQSNRLNFEENTWNSIKDSLSLQFLVEQDIDPQAKAKSYIMGYEVLEDGSVIVAKSDFTAENGMEAMTAEELKNLEKVFLYLDPKDTYNKKLLDKYNKAVNTGNEKEIQEALENLEANVGITLTDNEKFAGFLRAGIDNDSSTDTSIMYLQIRKAAAKALIESQNENLINLETTIPVNFSFSGSPIFNLKKEAGQLEIVNQPIGAKELSKIKDAGYVQEGELFIGGKVVSTNVNKRYLPKSKAKTPIIVFDYNGEMVAFPVNLNSGVVDKTQQLNSILSNPNLTDGQKVNEVNKLLILSEIEPKLFNLNEKDLQGTKMEALQQSLFAVEVLPNLNNWINKDFNLNDLATQATLPIDITNKPFNTPKVVMDVKSATQANPQDFRNSVEDNTLKVLRDIQEYYVETLLSSKGNFIDEIGDGIETAFTEVLDSNDTNEGIFRYIDYQGTNMANNLYMIQARNQTRLKNLLFDTFDLENNSFKKKKLDQIKIIEANLPINFLEDLRSNIIKYEKLNAQRSKLSAQIKNQVKNKQNQSC